MNNRRISGKEQGMKEQREELRDMAARQYEEDAQPKPVGVLDLAKMLLDGITITDPKQFRMIAHALICMNAALDEAKGEAMRANGRAKIATQKFRRAMSVCKSMRARIGQGDIMPIHYELHGPQSPIRCVSIVDQIIAAASYHAQETGRLPATVYLGEKEVGELLAYAQKLKATMGSPVQIEEKVCGYSLVRVKKESYLAVH